jgi:hypothetical protein
MRKNSEIHGSRDKAYLALEELDLEIDEDESIPDQVELFLESSQRRLQEYWDRWSERPIEQYVASDFRYVWAALQAIKRTSILKGNTFVEWGCGFGVITGLAWYSGLSAVGIEAETFLVDEGRKLLKEYAIRAELWHGNFLPPGAERIARQQADHPSLFHQVASAYSEHDCELNDFGLVFAYPWPGEEHFQREVFRRYAAPDALLLMFRGPYQIELFRQQPNE